MAEVIRYINTASTAGGDGTTNATSGANRAYASFSEWQSAESALHTPSNWHHVIATGSGALADSFTITSTGWGSSDFILIEVELASRPVNGVPKSGLYLSGNVGFSALVGIQRPRVYIVGLDVENTNTNGHCFSVDTSVTNLVLLKGCVAKAGSTAYRMSGVGSGGAVGIFDCIAYDSGIGILSANWDHLYAYGCTIDNCTDAIKKIATTGTGRITARNNVVIGGTNKYATPLADHFNTSDSASNATSDASTTNVPGSNPVANISSSDFENYAGNDFRLAIGSALINSGATSSTFYDDYDRAEYTVPTSDFLGMSRPQGGVWDVGAFERSAAASINVSVTTSTFSIDATNHPVAMPATLNAGDGIIVFLTTDGDATVTTPAGWRRLYTRANGTALRGSAYARVSRGTEGGTTVDFVTSAAETAAAQVYRITNWSGSLTGIQAAPAEEITSGTTADPPSLTTYWGSAKNLWLASVHTSTSQTVSSAPTNYTDLTQTTSGSGTTHAQCITARRAVETATEDPGVFTMSGSGASKVYSTVSIAPVGFAPQYEHFEITRGTTLWVGMYVSQPHTVADAAITRAVIVCHGSGLDAAEYANVVNSAMSANLGEAIVLTPFFSEGDDPEADQIFWGSSWARLGLSDASLAWRISSGEVLDELITHLHATFVNLEGVVIAGHSAGGQLVNRYSACSTATDNRYLVSAPSSYMYPGAERTDGVGGWFTPTTPTTYDDYKYGTQNLSSISYVNSIGAVALRSRLQTAKVHYLCGALDNDPADTSMDLSAEAALQGAHRVERQSLFVDYLQHYYAAALPNHVLVTPIAGVGHEINGSLASAEAVGVYMQDLIGGGFLPAWIVNSNRVIVG